MTIEEIKKQAALLRSYLEDPLEFSNLEWATSTILKLVEANEKLKQGLEWYKSLNENNDEKLDNCLEKALMLRSLDPANSIINPAGKFLSEVAVKAIIDSENILK